MVNPATAPPAKTVAGPTTAMIGRTPFFLPIW